VTHRLLVLYHQLTPYFSKCLKQFVNQYGAEVLVVSGGDDPNAPYKGDGMDGITLVRRESLDSTSMLRLASEFRPTGCFVSGWRDRSYLAVARRLTRLGLPVVMGADTQWNGGARQLLGTTFGRVIRSSLASDFWVPGPPGVQLGRSLGFEDARIHTGLYCADLTTFCTASPAPASARFVFVGRLVEAKGVKNLANAFQAAGLEQWRLLIVGTGPLSSMFDCDVPNVELLGFVDSSSLRDIGRDGGIFILPSRYEPWGVVVHEFAAMGFPLILTDAVGAASTFLDDKVNGLLVKGDEPSLRQAMQDLAGLDRKTRLGMGQESLRLSQRISHSSWTTTIANILDRGAE